MGRRVWAMAALIVLLGVLAGCARPPAELHGRVEVDGQTVAVRYDLRNFRLGRDGHVHISLDGGPEVMAGVDGYTFRQVAPGRHTVSVYVTDARHQPTELKQTVPFEVR